jgi:N-acetylmuramic acid 6-phosphate etherase
LVKGVWAQGGRLFYVGAGSSGRLGFLDAVECPPTFGVSPRMIQGILAGGKRALWRSVEGAEDDLDAGAQKIRSFGIGRKDVVCGISASGKTPFVWGALKEARKRKAGIVLITCQGYPPMAPLADIMIQPVVGPEVIAGSTRMKAGTATKMVLNMISTGAMIRLGKVYRNLMVDVRPSSTKLKERALGIIMSVLGCDRKRAQRLLTASRGRAKVALAMGAKNISRKEAEKWLAANQGFLEKTLSAVWP